MTAPAVLLDTSVVIDVERVDLGAFADRPVFLSTVTVAELAYGIGDPAGEARNARLRQVLAGYQVLPFGVEEAKTYGVLAALIRATGRDPRPRRTDLQVAATAAASRLPLLTTNPQHLVALTAMIDVVPMRRSG